MNCVLLVFFLFLLKLKPIIAGKKTQSCFISKQELFDYYNGLNDEISLMNENISTDLKNYLLQKFLFLNKNKDKYICNSRNFTKTEVNEVIILTNITNKQSNSINELEIENLGKNNECILLFAFYTDCPFSIKATPIYNALAKSYPQLFITALNSYENNDISFRLGLIEIPSILLLHKNKVVARYTNSSIDFDNLKKFLKDASDFEPVTKLIITEKDLKGPLPTKLDKKTDYILIFSIVVTLLILIFKFDMLNGFKIIKDFFYKTWHESQRNNSS